MRTISILFFTLLLLFFAGQLNSNAQSNLVQNGGFETWTASAPENWILEGSTVIYSKETTTVYEGSNALNVNVTATTAALRKVYQEIADIEDGQTYNLSFWYRVFQDPSNLTGGISYKYFWINEAGSYIGEGGSVDEYGNPVPLEYAKDTWLPLSEEITAPEGAVKLRLEIYFNRAVGVFIDDVQLIKVVPLSLSESAWSAEVAGGVKTITLTTELDWTAVSSDDSWLTVAPAEGSGDSMLTLTAEANPTTDTRTATVTVTAGEHTAAVVVTQPGSAPSLSLDATAADFTRLGGTKTINVTANVAWTATVSEDAGWLTIEQPADGEGDGSGALVLRAAENTAIGEEPRSATVTITGTGVEEAKTITVTQATRAAGISTSAASVSVAAAGGQQRINVSSNTTWTATKDADWITLASTSGSAGTTDFQYTVAANEGAQRTGAITFTTTGMVTATATLTVTQTGPVAVTGVTLNKETLTLAAGESETLIATVEPEDAGNKNVTWSSSNPAVATVDNAGTATPVANGTATITVTTVSGNKKATCEVTVTGFVGIWDTEDNTGFALQTNPVRDEARFTFAPAGSGARIVIISLTGKTVAAQYVAPGDTEAYLSVSSLSPGIYIARYTDNTGKHATVKMVK